MPRRKAGPRLWWRRDEAQWVILDTVDGKRVQHRTGCGEGDSAGAEAALERYLGSKRLAPGGPVSASEFMIAQALGVYAQEHGPSLKSPASLGYAIDALLPFWGELKVSAIRGELCRAYRNKRGVSDGTVRRELGVLAAALSHCRKEGYLIEAPTVWLPPMSQPRDRWLSRGELARLLWAARRVPHLARFILIGYYTGTRSGRVKALQWFPNLSGGHVDLAAGVLYRQPALDPVSKKRATPARMHRRLLNHLRRWSREGGQWVVEWRGAPIKSVKRSWNDARQRAGLGPDVVPHILRHTAITHAMQNRAKINDVCSLFGITMRELERTYLHHHPDHQQSALEALGR